MVRFIHTADWQIGMKAAHVGSVADQVRDERLKAARRVVEQANEQSADFLLVAGDTFEDNGVDRVLVQQVADILAGFKGPVYLIPGNHDPLVPGSVWEHPAWKSHANLNVLTETEPVSLDGAVILPCPVFEKYSRRDPTSWIDAAGTDRVAIGLAHGSVEGIGDDLDHPIPRDAADRRGLDYLALGHWHSTALIPSSDGKVRMAYSGTHETTRFGERDSGNVLLVEIAQRGAAPKLTPIRTGGLTWQVLEETVRSAEDLQRLRAQIEAVPAPDATLLELRLSGVLPAAGRSELDQIQQLLQARFLYGRLDASQLRPAPDDDAWIAELPPGLMRQVAERLRQLAEGSPYAGSPDYATPQVAARALLELYRLKSETQS